MGPPADCDPLPPPPPQVLRASKESVLTVVEVFIHDPLYKWALTTTAANRRQHDADAAAGGGLEVGRLRLASQGWRAPGRLARRAARGERGAAPRVR